MSDLTTSLILQLSNNQFTQGLRQSTQGVEQFSRQSRREMRSLKKSFSQLTGNVLGQFKNELLAVGGTWALINQSKRSGQLEKDLTRITQTAGTARIEAKELKKDLFALQRQLGVGVHSSTKSMDTLVQSGLTWEQSVMATKTTARGQAVSHVEANVLAGALTTAATHFGFDLAKYGVADDIMDKMIAAGGEGMAEVENLSDVFARIGGNATQAGLSMVETLGFAEQLSEFDANPERLATLSDSTLRIFTNQKYANNITDQLGIPFFDQEGARRHPLDVIGDIATLYQRQKTDEQRSALISAAFQKADLDTQKGIKALMAPGILDDMRDKIEIIGAAKGTVDERLKDSIDNSIDQVSRLKGALSEAADSFVTPFNTGVNEGIKKLLNSKEHGGLGLDGTDLMGIGGAALLAGGGAYKFGGPTMKKLLGKFGNVATGVATGKALEAATGVVPVYVVNMPAGPSIIGDIMRRKRSNVPGGIITTRGNRTLSRPPIPGISSNPSTRPSLPNSVGSIIEAETRAAKALKNLSKFGGPTLAVASGSYALYDTLSSDASTEEKAIDTAGLAGGLGGAWGLSVLGASIGTAIVPVIGTALGGLIGGGLGYFGGDYLATEVAKSVSALVSDSKKQETAKAELKITVEDGHTTVNPVSSDFLDMDISGSSMGNF